MVNNSNPYLRILPGLPAPPSDPVDRPECTIGTDPLWKLQELQDIVARHSPKAPTIWITTKDCERDYGELQAQGFDLQTHIAMLTDAHYKNSAWCRTSNKDGVAGRWIPCDAYALGVEYEGPVDGQWLKVKYYFKMCRGLGTGAVLFVSIHD